MNSRMEMLQQLWLRGISAPDAKAIYRQIYGDVVNLTSLCAMYETWNEASQHSSIQFFVMQKLRMIGSRVRNPMRGQL